MSRRFFSGNPLAKSPKISRHEGRGARQVNAIANWHFGQRRTGSSGLSWISSDALAGGSQRVSTTSATIVLIGTHYGLDGTHEHPMLELKRTSGSNAPTARNSIARGERRESANVAQPRVTSPSE